LQEVCEIKAGIHNGNIRKKLIVESKIDDKCKKLLAGKDVGRYAHKWAGTFIRYDPTIANKEKKEYCSLRDETIFTKNEKILIRDIGKRLPASFDDKQYYCMDTVYVAFLKKEFKKSLNLKYLLAILNSNLIEFYFRKIYGTVHVGSNYQRYKRQFLINLPIKLVDIKLQKKVVQLVDNMLKANKKLEDIGDALTDEHARLDKEVEKVDREIDELVYKLYGITNKERKIIEESLK
jgi:adenine-specific DNA-methyltransferase